MEYIENKTFDEITIGSTESIQHTLSYRDIELFAVMSGDVNPAHVDEEYAKDDRFHKIIAHGMWGGALLSSILGTKLPGPGTIYLNQTLNFKKPITVGDTITISVTVINKLPEKNIVEFDCKCVNQQGAIVIDGIAKVIAPTEKIRRKKVELPQIILKGDHVNNN